jgi:membrane-bound lytic murein transglycosylase D
MHRSTGAFKVLASLIVPLVLAACASAPTPKPAEPAALPVAPVEVHESEVANIDLTARAPADLWQRMRNGFAMPDLTTASADEKTAWYSARPEYLMRSFERARPFLFMIVEEIERRGMPTELALLPVVESAYNPQAVSSAQAAGMWQFIPSTGKKFNLKQDWWRDDRRDVMASTNAALDYLAALHEQFGDWHLALAAYNWGEGAVSRAVERARAKGEPTDYASLKMPAETAGYVPKLQAIKNIVMNPGQYGVTLPDVPNEPMLATVTKDRDIDVAVAAQLAEMPVSEFMALNPSHHRPVIPGAGKSVIVLPADKVATFNQNLEARDKPLSTWQAYLVKAGEKLEQIAARFGIDLAALRGANGIGPRQNVAVGHTLLVPRGAAVVSAELPAEISQPAFIDEAHVVRTTYVVRKGDNLALIARKFKVSPSDLKSWNHSLGNTVSAGQKLAVETVVVDRPHNLRYAKAVRHPVKHVVKRSISVARR